MGKRLVLKAVFSFYAKFGFSPEKVPFSIREKKFRIICMKEEIQEYQDTDDPVAELDALVDLLVFTLGTVVRQGFTNIFQEAFYRVMQANSQKKVGINLKRGAFKLDLIKPKGWKAPYLGDLIERNRKNT